MEVFSSLYSTHHIIDYYISESCLKGKHIFLHNIVLVTCL